MEEKNIVEPETIQKIEEKVEITAYDRILQTKFIIYNYITEDNESGTIITRPEMKDVFETNLLFVMENRQSKEFTLKELLESGQISCGSVDTMETLNMSMPLIGEGRMIIKGLHMHRSRQAISKLSGIQFEMDPESEDDLVPFD